jgi:PAS domain S-box-containing protein
MVNYVDSEKKIKDLKQGDHLCCIYETDEEHRTLITSFIKQGLHQEEKIFYIVDARTAKEIISYLREDGLKVEQFLENGQLRILSANESYTREKVFDPDAMISLLENETERALTEGYSALRVTEEMTWALRGLPGSDRLIEYETKLNEFLPNYKCLAICQYDRRRFQSSTLLDILTTHPLAIIGTKFYDNFYYFQPKDLLGADPETARLNNWLCNLKARKESEEVLQRSHNELELKVRSRTSDLRKANADLRQEIKERKYAERELREAELRYRTVADFTYDWEYWMDRDGKFLYVSPSCERISGYKSTEFINTPSLFRNIIAPEDREIWDKHHKNSTDTLKPGEVQFRIQTPSGEYKWIEHACQPVRGPQNQFLGFRASNREITDRKRSENALLKSEQSLIDAQRIAQLGNWEWNIETNELFWSDQVYLIFGLKPQEFGASYEAFLATVHPHDRKAVKKAVDQALKDPEYRYSIEHRMVRSDGSERIVHERGEVTFTKAGIAVRMIGTVQDITERERMKEILAQQLEEIKKLKRQLESENIYLRREIRLGEKHNEIVGKSDAIKYVLSQIEQVAPTNTLVLIQGETGTGKELIAQAIHKLSSCKDRMLVKVNCATLPASLIESELFGHIKGAFTGALSQQLGRFELADGSSLFLDEVGELSLNLQAKLLRILQEGEFERLGSPKTIKVNVRVIAASNRNLLDEVSKGFFREDLYYRLNVFPINIPPLRERREDIPLLVWSFVNEFSKKMGKEIQKISKKTMDSLQNYHWPGNIRELRNVIEHAFIISTGIELRVHLPETLKATGSSFYSLEENERTYITNILEKTNWRIKGDSGAAVILKLKPSTLYAKMNKLGIPTQQKKDNIST